MATSDINSSDFAYGKADASASTLEAPLFGTATFMRRPYSRDLDDVDIAVLGIPFDLAVCNRPGSRFGPEAIRRATRDPSCWENQYPWGFNPFKRLRVIDYGDVIYQYGDAATMVEQTQACVADIVSQGVQTLCLGGDHFSTLPVLREVAKQNGPVSLIQFDAHTDTERNDNPFDHGTVFHRAVEEGLVDPERSVQIGIRTDYDREQDRFTVLDSPWLHRNGVDATIEKIEQVVGDHQAYISFDIDALDPAYAPGTGTPVPGGLTSNQALEILRGLTDVSLIGMDVMEVAPDYDHSEITALVAGQLALEFVCVQASKVRGGTG